MWSLLVTFFIDSEVYLIVFSFMAIKGSSSPPSRVILTPNEYKEYIHRTQATKFASISFVVQIGNAFTAFHVHLDRGFSTLEPLIIFLVIRIFFLLLLLYHLYL